MKLSVLMITFNHEAYIAQALDSVLAQQTDFEFEIVIGEDCSADRTRAILLDYQRAHPDRIRLLLHANNVGMHANFAATYAACRGEYIALLEGDDWWSAAHKLQRQVDLLDAHPEVTECFHAVEKVIEGPTGQTQEGTPFPSLDRPTRYRLHDVLHDFFIPTPSVVLRRSALGELPALFGRMNNPDWMIHALCGHVGKIAFIPEVMGCYRVHAAGVWSALPRIKAIEKSIVSAGVLEELFDFRVNGPLAWRIVNWHKEAAQLLRADGRMVSAARHQAQAVLRQIAMRLSPAPSHQAA